MPHYQKAPYMSIWKKYHPRNRRNYNPLLDEQVQKDIDGDIYMCNCSNTNPTPCQTRCIQEYDELRRKYEILSTAIKELFQEPSLGSKAFDILVGYMNSI